MINVAGMEKFFMEKYNRVKRTQKYFHSNECATDELVREGLNYIATNNLNNSNNLPITENTIENCKKISLVTSCKNRNSFLFKAISTWLELPFDEIVIVDWDSKEPINISHPKVKVHRYENKKYYNHSEVRNVKVQLAKNEWILCIDCDVMLTKKFSTYILLNEDSFYKNSNTRADKGLFGTSLFTKTQYDVVGGFDNNISYWGGEDEEFYNRLIDKGYIPKNIYAHTMFHVEHDNNIRSKYTPYETIWRSLSENNYKIMVKNNEHRF